MPAIRPASSKPRKPKASNPRSTPKPPTPKSCKSRPSGVKSVACRAWWCESTFTRRADMLKHVDSEHFGKRFSCPVCNLIMKQESNLNTHLNAHFSHHCTLCSCGQGFTDPSACTRHRDATGHEKGITYRKVRPTIVKPIKVQHLAGLVLTVEMISDPNFVPPSFDRSYHLKGMPKPKAYEKFNSRDYLVAEQAGVPTIPSAQAPGISLAGAAPPTEYQELPPTEYHVPTQTEIQVDKLGLDVDFSYDVELPQETQYSESFRSPTDYPACDSQALPTGYYTAPEAIPIYPNPTVHYMPTDANVYPQQYPGNYIGIDSNYLPPPPFGSIPPPSLDVPPHRDFFEEMEFGMRAPEQFQRLQHQSPQFQPFYQPNINFSHMYQQALATY